MWLVGWGNRSRTGRKAEPLLSDRIVSCCDKVTTEHIHTHTRSRKTRRDSPNSPAGSVGEHYVAFLVCFLNECHARLFLPVTHGLLKHGPLAACNTHISHPTFTQSHVGVCFTVELYGQQSSGVAYRWSFLLWRREWLLQAISSQLGMWPLGEYGSSRRSQSSHLSQFGSWDWRLPCWSSWGDSLTERGKSTFTPSFCCWSIIMNISLEMCSEIIGSHYFLWYVTFWSLLSDQRVINPDRYSSAIFMKHLIKGFECRLNYQVVLKKKKWLKHSAVVDLIVRQ